MKNLAIIPARSGSKGLKDKNILELNGHPLMYYSIKAALDSRCFDTIMVSTDSKKYAKIAEVCGAEVPFLRSEKLSSDTAGSWDMVREVLKEYNNIGYEFDYVALLQPTSPLRDSEDIKRAYSMLSKPNVTNVVSVTEVDHPVQWCFELKEDGSMDAMARLPYIMRRRQDLTPYYRENGAIYIVDAKKIMEVSYNLYKDNCYASVMPRDKSVDIDTRIDYIVAEAMMAQII